MSDTKPEEGDKVLHVYNVPETLVPRINKYNREHRGPQGNAINITATCVKALEEELKKREVA